MTNAWGTDLVDGQDITWEQAIYAPRVEPPPPAYDPSTDIDSWESQQNVDAGVSTISGDPFDGGHATAATGYEDYSAPVAQPEQNPLLDPVMQEALAGFNSETVDEPSYAPSPVLGQTFPPQVFEDGSTAYPGDPGYNSVDVSGNPLLSDTGTMRFDPNIALDPSQVDDQRNKFNRAQQIVMDNMGVLRFADTGEPVDPSMYQYFGFGATGTPLNSASRSILSNPQFAESNAQFDATTNPANRNGVGITGGAVNALGGLLGMGADAASALRDLPMTTVVPYGPGGSISRQDTLGTHFDAMDLPSDVAADQTINVLGDNPYGRTAAAGVNALLDPLTIAGLFAGGPGLWANLLGKGDMAVAPYLASSFGAGAASQGAAEAGASPEVQLLAGLAGGMGGAIAPDIAGNFLRGLPQAGERSFGASIGPGSTDDAAREIMQNLEKVQAAEDAATGLTKNGEKVLAQVEANGFIPETPTAFMRKAALENNVVDRFESQTISGPELVDRLRAKSTGEALPSLPAGAHAGETPNVPSEGPLFRGEDTPAVTPAPNAEPGPLFRGPESSARITAPTTEVPSRTLASSAEEAASSAPPLTPRNAVAEAAQNPEDFAGNIRLAKLPPDIRETVTNWAESNPDLVDAARRGVRSDAQVLEDAKNLVNDLGGDFNKLQRSWRPGDAWNAETVTAIRGALTDSTRKVMDAATLARTADTTENQIALAEAILEQQRTQQIVTGVTAEAGRALRAFRQNAAEALQDGDVAKMQQILKMAIGKNDSADISMLSDAIKALDLNDPVAINNFIRNVNKPGFWDYFTEFYYNSILSGPWTHMRNAIGNTAATMSEPIRRAGAAAVETPLARLQGRSPERFWQEAPASVVGAVHGIPEGIRGALDTIRTGFDPSAASRIELRRQTAIPGPLGKAIRVPSTALEAADSFFHAINYRSSLYANATRAARSEGLKGSALTDRVAKLVAEPTPRLIKQSADDAERLLFRNDPGAFANWLARGKEQFPALQFITPFVKTPANILKFGIRNSPLGLLDVPMWRRVLAENPAGSDELAQTLIGSTVALGLGSLVANGQLDITAGVPTDAASRDAFYRQGKLPFAVKVPGVGWVQYNQIPGLDTTLTSLAAVVEGVRNGDNVDDIASQVGGTIAQSMLDRSYMSGLSDFMDAVGDPSRFAARYATRQATSAVPFSAFFRQIAQAMDPTIRDPKSLEDSFKANLPGLTGDVPPRLTALGDEAKRSAPSPIQVSTRDASSLDAELERLGVNVTFVGSSIAGHGLSDAEQRDYQELAGKTTAELLGALIADPRYQSLDDAGKQNIIEKAITMARDDAREMLKQNNYRIPAGAR